MGLANKILLKGDEAVKAILAEAKAEAKASKKALIDEADLDAKSRVELIKNEVDNEIITKERLLVFERRQAELLAKQNTINEIFTEVRTRIEALEGNDLLEYVTNQIKKEKVNKDEVMKVNKDNYERYLKALSTKEKANLVSLDKLNKKLDANFKLSSEPAEISNGFILEGEYFDINFAIEEVIEKLKRKHERQLVKELFE